MDIKTAFLWGVLPACVVVSAWASNYPYLRSKMSGTSRIPGHCERNDDSWFVHRETAQRCARLEKTFPFWRNLMEERADTILTRGKSCIFEKRRYVFDWVMRPDFYALYNARSLLKHLSLTEEEIKEEDDFILEYLLLVANEPDPLAFISDN